MTMSRPLLAILSEKWIWIHQVILFVIDDQGLMYSTDYNHSIMTLYPPHLDTPVDEWWNHAQANILSQGVPCPDFQALNSSLKSITQPPVLTTFDCQNHGSAYVTTYAFVNNESWILDQEGTKYKKNNDRAISALASKLKQISGIYLLKYPLQ